MSTSPWEGNMVQYSTVETLLEEVSKNMAASNISRYSRNFGGASGQRTSGSMRIVKPGSTSNSPRNSVSLGRRMTDGAYRRRLAMMDQNTLELNTLVSNNDGLHDTAQRAARPVSWHPASNHSNESSYHIQQPQYSSQTNNHQTWDLPLTPAVYSGYTSPASGFLPLSATYGGYEEQYHSSQHRPHTYHPTRYEMGVEPNAGMPFQAVNTSGITNMDPSMYSHFDWTNFATNGFEDSTAPPTPDNFLPIQHPEPAFPAEDSIPYHSLDESDDTGEELIGMGLYDSPEVVKFSQPDSYLDNYRSRMMSQLLGTAYRRPEPAGKGLKLEETWNPPVSEDGDDEDEDDSEKDGEGEDEEETSSDVVGNSLQPVEVAAVVRNAHLAGVNTIHQIQPNFGTQGYGRPGWL